MINVGNTTSCSGTSALEITRNRYSEIPNYEYMPVGPGEYKIVYGSAEKIITIT
jgi:hypothetical protein